jgi:hypothetical protein
MIQRRGQPVDSARAATLLVEKAYFDNHSGHWIFLAPSHYSLPFRPLQLCFCRSKCSRHDEICKIIPSTIASSPVMTGRAFERTRGNLAAGDKVTVNTENRAGEHVVNRISKTG